MRRASYPTSKAFLKAAESGHMLTAIEAAEDVAKVQGRLFQGDHRVVAVDDEDGGQFYELATCTTCSGDIEQDATEHSLCEGCGWLFHDPAMSTDRAIKDRGGSCGDEFFFDAGDGGQESANFCVACSQYISVEYWSSAQCGDGGLCSPDRSSYERDA